MIKPKPMPAEPVLVTGSAEKDVVILLSDMVGYSKRASNMSPTAIQSFMLAYHKTLKKIVHSVCGDDQTIHPSAGDGALAIFENRKGEDKSSVCNRALNTALAMVYAMDQELIPKTRIGLFSGTISEAELDGKMMRFGAGFSVASRLEELCQYFGTSLLMGREVATLQTEHAEFLTNIGKITPKNITHPIHIFSIFEPGIHQCPKDVDKEQLLQFIKTKNEGVELFCGHRLRGIHPHFPSAKQKLHEAQELFFDISGSIDLATNRLLQYIDKNPSPDTEFNIVGMKIWDAEAVTTEINLPSIAGELLKSANAELYHALIENTEWESKFKLIWRDKDTHVIKVHNTADGVYFIVKGRVSVQDKDGNHLDSLCEGDIFGELAYFSKKRIRTASVIAETDLVLRRISDKDLNDLHVIKKILKKIANNRINPLQREVKNS